MLELDRSLFLFQITVRRAGFTCRKGVDIVTSDGLVYLAWDIDIVTSDIDIVTSDIDIVTSDGLVYLAWEPNVWECFE